MRARFLLAVLALLLAACKTAGSEQQQMLTVYLENAAQYYDTGHYERAFQQWQKVLEIENDESRALLGQAMALYQMGREDSQKGFERLALAEGRLEELRKNGKLG